MTRSGNSISRGASKGLWIPYPLASLFLGITIAIVGPTLAFLISNASLQAKLDNLDATVRSLGEEVGALAQALQTGNEERARLQQWQVEVERRLAKLERL